MPNPRSVQEIQIPDQLKVATRDDSFLFWDSGDDDPQRLFVFWNIDTLEQNPHWFMDGTFKVAPELFVQLFTIHALVDRRAMPMMYVLLQSKQKSSRLQTSISQIVAEQKYIGTVKHFVGLRESYPTSMCRRFSTCHPYWLPVSPRTISVAQNPKLNDNRPAELAVDGCAVVVVARLQPFQFLCGICGRASRTDYRERIIQ